jgi:hypothetical protein
MTVSFSKESRYRNISSTGESRRGGRTLPQGPIIIVAAVILLLCCCCLGLVIGSTIPSRNGQSLMDQFSANIPSIGGPTVTPTPDKNAIVLPNKPGLADNGLELTIIGFQRPLKVQGTVPLPPDQQFVLATARIRNTKKTGTPVKVTAADFQVKGDGGLVYTPNPKQVTIPNILTELNIPAGATQEGELIFQIAADDTGLKLQWKAGAQTRIFQLETK